MRPFSLLPALVAIVLAPALSHAETYTGTSHTTAVSKSRGHFELHLVGSRLKGWVASSALQNNLRVSGRVNPAGEFQLRSRNSRVKGLISGKVTADKIRGSGRFFTKGAGSARVVLDGKSGPAPVNGSIHPDYPINHDMTGVTITLPSPSKEQWDKNGLFSYVDVHFKELGITGGDRWYYRFDAYFAGKSGVLSYATPWRAELTPGATGEFEGEGWLIGTDYGNIVFRIRGRNISGRFRITMETYPNETDRYPAGYYEVFLP